MRTRRIGNRDVSALGLGMALLAMRGPSSPLDVAATVHAALDHGINLIDTADSYAPSPKEFGRGEDLVRQALASCRRDAGGVLVATKFGHTRTTDRDWRLNGHPSYVRQACEASLRRLGVESIGLYQYHRPDPAVPYADTIGALKELKDAGKVGMIGISNANLEQIGIARTVLGPGGLASVQNRFSLDHLSAHEELRYCAEHDIAFLPWAPLGGPTAARAAGQRTGPLRRIAQLHKTSPQSVCLAWLLAQAPNVIPIPGSTRPETIADSAGGTELVLTDDELAALSAVVPDG